MTYEQALREIRSALEDSRMILHTVVKEAIDTLERHFKSNKKKEDSKMKAFEEWHNKHGRRFEYAKETEKDAWKAALKHTLSLENLREPGWVFDYLRYELGINEHLPNEIISKGEPKNG